MRQPTKILAIDQGTTNTRALIIDKNGKTLAKAKKQLPQLYPARGLVEHDPETIWKITRSVCRNVLSNFKNEVAAIGITNQRETIVVWDRLTGKPVYNAIVWQDRRTNATCAHLREQDLEAMVNERTGLLLDPYFTATKLSWILDNVEGARRKAEQGVLAAGTIDSFLLWRLTDGRAHATDASNASRTLLFNIRNQEWDPDLLALFNIPRAILPDVKDSTHYYGSSSTNALGEAIPIFGIAGDQHAALIGQACIRPGMIKSTFGTGCFALVNTGIQPIRSRHRLLTTIAYRIDGIPYYAIEGSIFNAGSTIQWLHDSLGLIQSGHSSNHQDTTSSSHTGVVFVPAFTGLGAPYWDADARGAIYGLTRDTGPAELTRAALESVGYQTADLLAAMADDGTETATTLRVDGGMTKNNWMLQFLADITGIDIERPAVIETTALGAAWLAGLGAGLIESLEDLAHDWQLDRTFKPQMSLSERWSLRANWGEAIQSTRSFGSPTKISSQKYE